MQHDAREHHVGADVEHVAVWVGGGGDSTPASLEDKGEDVRGYEGPGVVAGGEAVEVRAEGEGEVLEGQVDGGADEGRGHDEAADLDFESGGGPGVRVEEDAADVADAFG